MDILEHTANFQFIGKSIKEISVSNDFANINDSDMFQRNIDVDYKIGKIKITEDKKVALMHLILTVTLLKDEQSTKIHYVVEGCFTVPSNTDDSDFITMLSVNGCTALYSMARADISSISSHIFNSGKILLPMINVWEFVKAKNK